MESSASEIAVRDVIEDWVDAICKGDLDRIVRHRAPEIVMFDVPEPIQEKGLDAYRATWQLFFDHNPPGPDCFRISELKVVAGDDVSFAHVLLDIGAGQAHCRLTLGFEKAGADWRVSHEHHSMPIRLKN